MNKVILSTYRVFCSLTLVLSTIFTSGEVAYAVTGAPLSDKQLLEVIQLTNDSPKLRRTLPTLKEKAKSTSNINARLLYAKALLSIKDYDEGIRVLNTINSDAEPRALALLAKANELTKNYAEKARHLELLKKKFEASSLVAVWLARAYFESKQLPKSVELLRGEIKKNKALKTPYFALLDILEEAKNNYEVRILLSDMLQAFPNDPQVHTRHCRYFAEGGFLEDAATSCERAIEFAPEVAENHVNLGITKSNLNETAAAEKILKHAAARFPKSEPAQYTAGKLMDESKNWHASAKYYKTCVKFNKSSDRCHRGLANASYQTTDYETALNSYSIACNKDPKARVDFRNALTDLRNKMKNAWADKFVKKFERCGLKD